MILVVIGFVKLIGLPKLKDVPLFYQIFFNRAMTTITASTMKFLLFMPQAIAEVQTAPSPSLLAGVFPSAIAKLIGDATNSMFVTPLLEIVLTGGFLILPGVGLFNNRGKIGVRLQPSLGRGSAWKRPTTPVKCVVGSQYDVVLSCYFFLI